VYIRGLLRQNKCVRERERERRRRRRKGSLLGLSNLVAMKQLPNGEGWGWANECQSRNEWEINVSFPQ
jgi:hypothetical protein